ncbi:twinfilin [Planococcus citri]|uniref:twinfilin n=1 Tax=Planococcus citri TaxID=170843 RepID=UPI0031F72D18
MSHQTGIKANEELRKFFAKCKLGKIRVVKVSIENEQLTLSDYKEVEKTWDDDFDKMVGPMIESSQPSYILYRLDHRNETGYDWLLISWSPDDAPVRQKMLYASTKATLKQEFGNNCISEELHGTSEHEITLGGLTKNRKADSSPAPLTTQEEELARLRKVENITLSNAGIDSRAQTLSGVSFPISNAVIDSVNSMVKKKINYIQLKIDIENEEIHLVRDDVIPVDKLSEQIPKDNARYHLYSFSHKYEGSTIQSVVFIYSMPGYSCSVKERMLYSSCKGPLLDIIESNLGLTISKKLEIGSEEELTEDYLIEEIHPKKVVDKPKFEKPKGPPSRGAKRLTKIQKT